jgi:hypothetical protein
MAVTLASAFDNGCNHKAACGERRDVTTKSRIVQVGGIKLSTHLSVKPHKLTSNEIFTADLNFNLIKFSIIMAEIVETTRRQSLRNGSVATQRTATFSRPVIQEVIVRKGSNASRRALNREAPRRKSSIRRNSHAHGKSHMFKDFFNSSLFKITAILSAVAFLAITTLFLTRVCSFMLNLCKRER